MKSQFMSTTPWQRSRWPREVLLSDRYYRESILERDLRPSSLLPATSMQAEWPFVIPFGEDMLIFEARPVDWILPVLEQISQLGSLPFNWDSYGSQAIKPEIALTALELILTLLQENDPKPSIVPTSRGGIMLEWHQRGIDLEVDIRSPSWIHLSFEWDGEEEVIERANLESIAKKLDILRPSRS